MPLYGPLPRGIAIAALCGAWLSCEQPGTPPATVPVLSDEQLVELLKDVHLAEAALLQCEPSRRDSAHKAYYAAIFRMHGVARDDFEQSIAALLSDPQRTMLVYGRVSERLIQEETQKE